MKHFVLFLALITSNISIAQEKKTVSISDVWETYRFHTSGVSGLKSLADGEHFTTRKKTGKHTAILKHAYKSGEAIDTLFSTTMMDEPITFDGYSISPDERFVLLFSETESIYRHSSKSVVNVFDLSTKSNYLISKDKIQLPIVSPDARFVSYVYQNNLYLYNLENKAVKAITNDGEINKIIYGATDWVYEEEFQFDQAYEWSPDGKYLAYYRFDETDVLEFSMDIFGKELYPTQERFKYPKAGEDNAVVRIFTYQPDDNEHNAVTIENQPEYVGRIKWRNKNELALLTLNRHQSELIIYNHNVKTNQTTDWYRETDEAFVEMDDNQFFLPDGDLIRLSGKDGFYHLYRISNKGKERQVTSGKWDVTELYGYNPSSKRLYFQAAKDHPTERGVYSVKLNGTSMESLHNEKGWNSADFSAQCRYFINNHSRMERVNRYNLHDHKGTLIRTLNDNAGVQKRIDERYVLGESSFFAFTTEEGVDLNGFMIKPPDFDPAKTYPVWMFVYGGPGSQTVKNSYDGFNHFWFQHLASKGYIVVSIDNRGTGARGRDFKKTTYQQLGHYELIDQMEAARWLGKQSYVDPMRIGIWGWSYGGYMSSLAITRGADLFCTAIAVAPVTTWRYYNTIYTERYMRTPQENPSGYDDNSPVNYSKKLKGKFLLVHGTADDNVHVQNAMQMINALIDDNKPFEQFLYPDRNHGIFGGTTRLHLYNMMTRFIEQTL